MCGKYFQHKSRYSERPALPLFLMLRFIFCCGLGFEIPMFRLYLSVKRQFLDSGDLLWSGRHLSKDQKEMDGFGHVTCAWFRGHWRSPVDGWNPKQPPGMYKFKTLWVMGETTYQLVQGFSHQQSHPGTLITLPDSTAYQLRELVPSTVRD